MQDGHAPRAPGASARIWNRAAMARQNQRLGAAQVSLGAGDIIELDSI